jgi:hypothetical protein
MLSFPSFRYLHEGRIAIVTDVVRNAVDADVAVDERH